MIKVFNCGVGMMLIVKKEDVSKIYDQLANIFKLGEIIKNTS